MGTEGHTEALFQGVFEAAPDAVVIVEASGCIVLANAQCQTVFDRTPESLVGEPIELLVPDRFRFGHPTRRSGYATDPNPRPMGRLVQVLENIVTNALKFTRPGGRVDVSIHDRGTMGVLEVRDTGTGVTAEERTKIFERLYRAPAAIAEQTQGAGLGLAIVRAIVEAHGGWVDLDSEVGVGTVVRVAVPYADQPDLG